MAAERRFAGLPPYADLRQSRMADRSDATSAIRTSIFVFVVVAGDEDDSDSDEDDDSDSDWDGAGSSSGETDMIRSAEKRSANGAGRDRRRIISGMVYNLGQNK